MARKLPKYVRAILNRDGDTFRYLFRRVDGAAAAAAQAKVQVIDVGERCCCCCCCCRASGGRRCANNCARSERRSHSALPLYSEDFWQTYAAALATVKGAAVGAGRTGPGTIDALAVSFYKSTAWEALTGSSRSTYRPIIERLRAKDGTKRVALLRPDIVAAMLDQIEKPSAKKKFLVALRMLMAAAIPGLRKDDPTLGIKVKLAKSKGHHSWADDEIERYRAHWRLGTAARLVLEFALETTSRRMEVARLGPQHVKDGRINWDRKRRLPVGRDCRYLVTLALAGRHRRLARRSACGPMWWASAASRFRLTPWRTNSPSGRPRPACRRIVGCTALRSPACAASPRRARARTSCNRYPVTRHWRIDPVSPVFPRPASADVKLAETRPMREQFTSTVR